jgi:hypothetical protein
MRDVLRQSKHLEQLAVCMQCPHKLGLAYSTVMIGISTRKDAPELWPSLFRR